MASFAESWPAQKKSPEVHVYYVVSSPKVVAIAERGLEKFLFFFSLTLFMSIEFTTRNHDMRITRV